MRFGIGVVNPVLLIVIILIQISLEHVVAQNGNEINLSQGTNAGGACTLAKSCESCAKSASSLLQQSSGQYTCIWKLLPTPTSDEKNNKKRDLDVNLGCELIPFSNAVLSAQSVPCDANTSFLRKKAKDQQESQKQNNDVKQKKGVRNQIGKRIQQDVYDDEKKKKPINFTSVSIVLLFFFLLFRTRAFILGQPFVPPIISRIYQHLTQKNKGQLSSSGRYRNRQSSKNITNNGDKSGWFGKKSGNDQHKSSKSKNRGSTRGILSDHNVQER